MSFSLPDIQLHRSNPPQDLAAPCSAFMHQTGPHVCTDTECYLPNSNTHVCLDGDYLCPFTVPNCQMSVWINNLSVERDRPGHVLQKLLNGHLISTCILTLRIKQNAKQFSLTDAVSLCLSAKLSQYLAAVSMYQFSCYIVTLGITRKFYVS